MINLSSDKSYQVLNSQRNEKGVMAGDVLHVAMFAEGVKINSESLNDAFKE